MLTRALINWIQATCGAEVRDYKLEAHAEWPILENFNNKLNHIYTSLLFHYQSFDIDHQLDAKWSIYF